MTQSLHTKEYEAFVALLIKTRKASGMTQQDVADKLGKPQSYIAKIEGGERRVDVVEFAKLAEAMGSDPVKLFRGWISAG